MKFHSTKGDICLRYWNGVNQVVWIKFLILEYKGNAIYDPSAHLSQYLLHRLQEMQTQSYLLVKVKLFKIIQFSIK